MGGGGAGVQGLSVGFGGLVELGFFAAQLGDLIDPAGPAGQLGQSRQGPGVPGSYWSSRSRPLPPGAVTRVTGQPDPNALGTLGLESRLADGTWPRRPRQGDRWPLPSRAGPARPPGHQAGRQALLQPVVGLGELGSVDRQVGTTQPNSVVIGCRSPITVQPRSQAPAA